MTANAGILPQERSAFPQDATVAVPATVLAIIDALRWAPSADNRQPWRFSWNGGVLTAQRLRLSQTMSSAAQLAEKVSWGGLHEYMLQAAYAWGLDTGFEADHDHVVLPISAGEAEPHDPHLVHLLKTRSTRRGPFRRARPPQQLLASIPSLGLTCASARVVPTVDQSDLIRHVALLSRLRFGLRPLHEDLASALTPEGSDEGLPLSNLELPPGGNTFLRLLLPWPAMACAGFFGAHRLLAKLEVGLLNRAPALVVLGATPDEQGALECGRLLVRIGLAATAAGHVLHPYFLLGGMDHLLSQAISSGITAGERAQALRALDEIASALPSRHRPRFLIRIGIPCTQAKRSRRLRVDRLLTVSRALS